METNEVRRSGKLHNTLPLWGNEATMNLNPLILANIQGSSYFKVHLFKLKTYHEVVDEIYYQVKHLEPWERGSRKTAGQTGMCGGVRGVGAGGIVSTAYCLLYKLYTLRLTRKQVNGLLSHTDSPYIRALGFMYIRYTQPPGDLYDWYEDYFLDDEEIDIKAGGGQVVTIGQMAHQFLTKLDWFSTLFPRIPVPIQKQIENKLNNYCRINNITLNSLRITNVPNYQNNIPAYQSSTRFDNENEVNRKRRDDIEHHGRCRERERTRESSREYTNHQKHRRREKYERSRSRSRHDHHDNHKDKHKKKRKHKSKDCSKEKNRDKYKDHKERDSERYRGSERDYERKYY